MIDAINPVAFDVFCRKNVTTRKVFISFLFALLTAMSAYIRIPLGFTPVPVTLQTLFVMTSGIFLGAEYGLSSMLMYITLGCLGLPVFSNGESGINALFGVTGGYLLGFLLFSWISGKIYYNSSFLKLSSLLQVFILYLISVFTIFIPGVLWLKISMNIDTIGAITLGFIPFIIADLLKIIAGFIFVKYLQGYRN